MDISQYNQLTANRVIKREAYEKKEILEASTEQQETIEERRGLKEIEKDLDDTRYAIKKEIQSYEQEEKKIHQFEKTELGKQAEKAKLILKYLKKMRKLHEKQAELHKEFLNCQMLKYRREPCRNQ